MARRARTVRSPGNQKAWIAGETRGFTVFIDTPLEDHGYVRLAAEADQWLRGVKIDPAPPGSLAADHPEVVKWEPTQVYIGKVFRDTKGGCALEVQLEAPVDVYHAMRLVTEYIEKRGLRARTYGPLVWHEFGSAGGSTSQTRADNLTQVRYAYEYKTSESRRRQMVMAYVNWDDRAAFDPMWL
ncbi:hypothetical protein LTR17_022719 [Elasticomyces elasticus]|nr:hypothetical protein LTR17_022719 [Elasticomyces elasticus]